MRGRGLGSGQTGKVTLKEVVGGGTDVVEQTEELKCESMRIKRIKGRSEVTRTDRMGLDPFPEVANSLECVCASDVTTIHESV